MTEKKKVKALILIFFLPEKTRQVSVPFHHESISLLQPQTPPFYRLRKKERQD